MKSYSHLFERICDLDNIIAAIDSASLGKRNRRDVKRVMQKKEKFALRTKELLETRRFYIPEHKSKIIIDRGSGKARKIICPRFLYEQIVHHAIMQQIMPIVMHGMYEYSCGSVPGRGSSYGRKYIERFIRNNPKKCRYVLKMDIRHYFQSIDHDILKTKLARIFHDENLMWLLNMIIDSYVDDESGKGIPIGYYSSQWFSNFYLQDLDHFIKQELHAPCYVRYVDDMVILGSNKRDLHKMRIRIEKELHKIGLEMKNNWQIFKFDYNGKYRFIDFMGFRFYRNRTTLRRGTWNRAIRKSRTIKKAKKTSWYTASQMLSYLGFIQHIDCYNGYKTYILPNINVKCLKALVSRKGKKDALEECGKLCESCVA